MKILLDTHIFYWLATDSSRVAPSLRGFLDDLENEIFFSSVVSWEIAQKRAKGKLHFTGSPAQVAAKMGLSKLAITAEHAEAAAELPPYHFDPFDRLLIAQAQTEGLVLATADPVMIRYGIGTLRNAFK